MHQFIAVHTAVKLFHTLFGKFNHAVFEGKQGKIFAGSNILPRMKLSSLLANKNAACANELTCKKFNTQAFCIGIPTIFCRTTSFFMRHENKIRKRRDFSGFMTIWQEENCKKPKNRVE